MRERFREKNLKCIGALYPSPWAQLIAGLFFGILLSSLSVHAAGDEGHSTLGNPVHPEEDSPEDIAKALGLPEEEKSDPLSTLLQFVTPSPNPRVVAPEDFKNFRLTVDIFRKSTAKPVLGEFRDEYLSVLVPKAGGMSESQRFIEGKKRFTTLAKKEFAIVSLDGTPVKAYLISTGLEQYIDQAVKGPDGKPVIDPVTGQVVTKRSFKTTPPGAYRLDPFIYERRLKSSDGTVEKKRVADPWLRSETYQLSPMYWGLWIHGGYLIHSTPHYGQLGQPASMGCIRQSFPDAMELFSHLVQENLPGMIRIHRLGSDAAIARVRELVFDAGFTPGNSALTPLDITKDMNWLLGELDTNLNKIRDTIGYYGPELEILGHDWIHPEINKPAPTLWPLCGPNDSGIDCFKPWGVKKPGNSRN